MTSSWEKNWQELQDQYIETMRMFTSLSSNIDYSSTPGFGGTGFPGGALFGMPTETASIGGSPGVSDFIHSCRYWGRFAGQFQTLMQAMASAGEAGDEWQSQLSRQIELIKSTLSQASTVEDSNDVSRVLAEQMQAWRKGFESISATGDTSGNIAGADSLEDFFSAFSTSDTSMFSLWQDYQEKLSDYRELLRLIDIQSLDRLHEKILEIAKNGETISGAKDVFKLWVDSHEEIWTRHICTEEYSKLYGEITNALVLFQKQYQGLANKMQPAANESDTEKSELVSKLNELKGRQEEDRKKIELLEKELATVLGSLEVNVVRKTPANKKKSKASRKKGE